MCSHKPASGGGTCNLTLHWNQRKDRQTQSQQRGRDEGQSRNVEEEKRRKKLGQRDGSARSVGGPGSIPGSGRSPEKAMATHSGTLAWRIPWMEEPGGLQSMGSHSQTRLRDLTFTFKQN